MNEIKETVRHSVCILFSWRYNSQTTYNEKHDVLFCFSRSGRVMK